jgi:hypothetical protein
MSEKRVIRAGITRQKLAKYYNVDVETITFWLREVEVTHQRNLKPIEIARLILSVGPPDIDIEIRIPFLKFEPIEYNTAIQKPIQFGKVA